MKTLGIIPSRFASTRFPGKPLIDLDGKTMIQRVYEQCSKATLLDQVIVATDDQRIYDHVLSFNGQVLMTSSNHQTGTSRCVEVAKQITSADIVINIQGDEPMLAPEQINDLIKVSGKGIATQAKKITQTEDLFNSNIVKVVFDKNQQALYFSRQAIPFGRSQDKFSWIRNHDYYKHIGLYSFDRATLLELDKLPHSNLEKMESLEQLRWLESGIPITVGITNHTALSIDTPDDADRIRKILSSDHT